MNDKDKTNEQLLAELADLRQRLARLESSDVELQQCAQEMAVLAALSQQLSSPLSLEQTVQAALRSTSPSTHHRLSIIASRRVAFPMCPLYHGREGL